jgi:hypothetical protein
LKKKIILIGPAYPYRGGNALFITHTFESLKKDFNVKIFNYKLLYPSFLFPGTTQFDKSKEQVFQVPSERIINSINPFNWIKTASLLKKENADLIVFDWWHPFFGFCHGIICFFIVEILFSGILRIYILQDLFKMVIFYAFFLLNLKLANHGSIQLAGSIIRNLRDVRSI